MDRTNGARRTIDDKHSRNNPPAVKGTEITPEFLNNVQEELLFLLAEAGLTPDRENETQVRAAIQVFLDDLYDAVTSDIAAAVAARLSVTAAEANYARVLARTGIVDVDNTAAETDLIAFQVPAPTLRTNRRIRISGTGTWLHDGTNTFLLKAKYGATGEVACPVPTTGTATDTSNGNVFAYEVDIVETAEGEHRISVRVFSGRDSTQVAEVSAATDNGVHSTGSPIDVYVKADWQDADTSDEIHVRSDAVLY